MSVYKLVAPDTDKIYIGSTTYSLKGRLRTHRNAFNKYLKNQSQRCYCSSYQLLKYNDCRIELIEEIIDKNNPHILDILKEREDYYIFHQAYRDKAVNQRTPVSEEPYHISYYKKNRDRMIQNSLNSYYRHKEKRLAYQLAYGRRNREKLREQARAYHRKNEDKIKGECKICNKVYRNLIAHYKSQKHKKNAATNEEQSQSEIEC